MNDSTNNHLLAMEHADAGDILLRKGEQDAALCEFDIACKFEELAACSFAPSPDHEPTRSILFRSAASLAYQCRQYRHAETLIYRGLLGHPPNVIRRELKELLQTVTFEEHLDLDGLALSSSQIALSLWGDVIGHGFADSSLVHSRWSALNKLLYRTTERLLGIKYRDKGEPSTQVKSQFRVYASVPMAASYAIVFRVGGQFEQESLFGLSPGKVVSEILSTFQMIEADDVSSLEKVFGSNEDYLINFYGLAGQIVPDGRAIKNVGLTGRGVGEQITNVPIRKSRPRVREQASRLNLMSTIADAVETCIEGTLEAADNNTKADSKAQGFVAVRDASNQRTKILVPVGLMADVVRPNFGRWVRVTASYSQDQYHLVDISTLED